MIEIWREVEILAMQVPVKQGFEKHNQPDACRPELVGFTQIKT